MIVSPDALRKEIVQTLSMVNEQIDEIRRRSAAMERPIEPALMQDHQGNFILTPLLLAKAQCLSTLTLLNQPRESRSARRA